MREAAPFDCLCLQGDGIDLVPSNLSSIVSHFAQRIPAARAVFVAAYRLDLVGLEPFRDVWEDVYALALYDWNGSGLQGRQFSSAINRLICQHAERV